MAKGVKYARKATKPRYGYKPKTLRLSQFSLSDALAAVINPAVRVFTQGLGYDWGIDKVGGKNVRWANATAGAANNAEAISKIREVSPGVADRAEAFTRAAAGVKGHTGLVWVRNNMTGETLPMSRAAFDLNQAGAHDDALSLLGTTKPAGIRPKVYA